MWRIIYKTGCCSPLTQTLCYWQLRKDVQPALNHLVVILSICILSSMFLKHLFSTAGRMAFTGCPFTIIKVVEEQNFRLQNQKSVVKSSLNRTASVPWSRPGLAAECPCPVSGIQCPTLCSFNIGMRFLSAPFWGLLQKTWGSICSF